VFDRIVTDSSMPGLIVALSFRRIARIFAERVVGSSTGSIAAIRPPSVTPGRAGAFASIVWPTLTDDSKVSGMSKSSLIVLMSLIVVISVPAATTAPTDIRRSEA
jgi:hypothetical protein